MSETTLELPTQITSIGDISTCAYRIEHNKCMQDVRNRNMASITIQLVQAYQSKDGEPRKNELRRAHRAYELRSQICEKQTIRLENLIPTIDEQIAFGII